MEDPTLDDRSEKSLLLESDQMTSHEEEEVYSKKQRVDVPTSGIDGTVSGARDSRCCTGVGVRTRSESRLLIHFRQRALV